jgi:hypothetical protein
LPQRRQPPRNSAGVLVAPSGGIVSACSTTGDKLAIARCDRARTKSYNTTTFNFARHRKPNAYRMIVARKDVEPPSEG